MRMLLIFGLLLGKINFTLAYEVFDSNLIEKIREHGLQKFDGLPLIKEFQKNFAIQFELNVTNNLKSTQLSQIKIEQENLILAIHPDALKNPWVTQEIIEEMRGLHLLYKQADFYIYKELLLNSKFGDSNAEKGLIAFEESATYRAHKLQNSPHVFDLIDGNHLQGEYEDYLHLRISDLINRRNSIIDLSKKAKTKINQNIYLEIQELAMNNDRKGVAKLLKSTISWNLLTETEKRAYSDFISSIENPSRNKVILFRGLGKDQVNEQIESKGVFSKSVQNGALDEEISSLRNDAKFSDFYLPDLESKQWKWSHVDSFVASARLHGTYAKTTPYISSTPSLDIALSFSKEGYQNSNLRRVLLIEIDQSRLLPNIFSQFSELEYLVPFLIFPDEIKKDITGTDLQIRQQMAEYIQEKKTLSIDQIISNFEQEGRFFLKKIESCNWLLRGI